MPLKVVVTGAYGFLGRHIVRLLEARGGVEVIAVSRREIHGWYQVSNYAQSPYGDVLIHLAEDSDRAQVAKAGRVYEDHTLTTLHALLAKGYSRIVYASSAVLYGDQHDRPRSPGDQIQVDDAYTRVKRESEVAVLNLPGGVVARLSNLYGPSMAQGNVLSTILRQIPGEGPLEVLDTAPVRDFLWVSDAADGLIALALSDLGRRRGGHLYNLGTGNGVSIGDLARLALDLAGQANRQVEAKRSSLRQSTLILDYSETTAVCGWTPKTPLRRGIGELLQARLGKT